MRLTSFQINNCFGFVDSGEIVLETSNNFVYILGRNSSGKSSLLNSIKYFGNGITPSEKQNWKNFISSEAGSYFVAEFNLDGNSIDYEKFDDNFDELLDSLEIDFTDEINASVNQIKTIYKKAIDELNTDKKCVIYKFSSGNYYFGRDTDNDSYQLRRKEIEKIATEAGLNTDFNKIENLIFNQFPTISLFNEKYSLNDSLPNKITSTWKKSENNFEKRFVEYLGSDDVEKILSINNPRERREIEHKLNSKVKLLTDKVNESRASSTNSDLLEILLDVSPDGGIQITLYTDGKPSFYSHLSENTKFLFAYHLYQTTADISGNILLFDEPNNGFHPTAQRLLLRFLQKLAQDGNLVIVSTHSEHLIDTDSLASVRLMSADKNKNIIVKNHYYNQPKESGDYLALQPIFDAIGYKYGTQIGIKDKVVITEGITDLLYLRTFNKILKISDNLDIAPARGDSTILQIVPFLISQGINFKIVIDVGNVKEKIKTAFGIDNKFFYEIPIPSFFPKMQGSGIEDLFSKPDFKKMLADRKHVFVPQFTKVSNSCYMNLSDANKIEKRLLAEDLYKKADSLSESDFDTETVDNFRKVLQFCSNSDWFSL